MGEQGSESGGDAGPRQERVYSMQVFDIVRDSTRLKLLKELHTLLRCRDKAIVELEDAFLLPPQEQSDASSASPATNTKLGRAGDGGAGGGGGTHPASTASTSRAGAAAGWLLLDDGGPLRGRALPRGRGGKGAEPHSQNRELASTAPLPGSQVKDLSSSPVPANLPQRHMPRQGSGILRVRVLPEYREASVASIDSPGRARGPAPSPGTALLRKRRELAQDYRHGAGSLSARASPFHVCAASHDPRP